MCNRNYATSSCVAGTEDEVGSVRFNVKDFLVRPANLPPPASPAPLFAGVVARGAGADLVQFEAAGRLTNIKEAQYVNDGETFGVKTRIGGGKDLVVDLDIQDVVFDGITPVGTLADVKANTLIQPLPEEMTFCLRRDGTPLTAGTDPVLTPCASTNPFGDGTVQKSPMTLGFRSSDVFRTVVTAEAVLDRATPGILTDDIRAAADLTVERLPQNLTARVSMPAEGSTDPIRILTESDPGANIDVLLHGEFGIGGATCTQPDPVGDNVCADLNIDDLPLTTSALIGGPKNANRAEFHACNYRFFDAPPKCAAGTQGEIKSLLVDGRVVLGNPGELAALAPDTDMHAILQARMPSEDDIAFRARARFEKIRSVFFRQAADGFDAFYELGDGIKPFEAKVDADTRSGLGGPNPTGLKLDGKVRLTPLPQRVAVGQHGGGDTPMVLSYDASSDVDVDGFANLVLAKSPPGATCGASGTACATLDIDNIPAKFVATLGREGLAQPSSALLERTTLKTKYANLNGPDKVDVRAEVIAGLPTDTPVFGATPVRARVELLGLPRFTTTVMDNQVTNPNTAAEVKDLQRFAMQTCDVLPGGLCDAGTEDQLDSLYIEAGTYLTRPLGMPAPGAGITDPLWAHIVGRGNDLQAALKLVNISEIQYVNDKVRGLTAAKARIGNTQPLTAKVDIEGMALGDIVLGAMAVNDATLDIHTLARINPLPSSVEFCLRSSGKPTGGPASANPITATCEDTTQFGNVTVPHTPLSVGYLANAVIDTFSIEADVATKGLYNAGPSAGSPIEPRRLYGKIVVSDIPKKIVLHVLTPADDAAGNSKGATRVRYEALNPGGPGMSIEARAHQTIGDAVCQDPRPTATALCVGATLRDLPQTFSLDWEPDKSKDNLDIKTTGGGGDMDFDDLELSSVKPRLDGAGVPVLPLKSDVMIATGAVKGIDHNITVKGNLGLPKAEGGSGAVDLTATIRIKEITVAVKNFVAPNPFVAAVPARPVHKHAVTPSVLQTATFRQRGELFLAEATIKDVAGFGYRGVTTNSGAPTGTSVVTVDFGKNFAVRAYADIAPDNTTRIIGDVLLEQVPAGLSFCFRGPKDPINAPGTGQENYCDDLTKEHKADDGAFQFLGSPDADDLDGLDVDAFVRLVNGSSTNILSGRVNIDNIPYRVEGAIPAGGGKRLDVATKDKDGNPDGIDQIRFAFATFDLPRAGTVNYPDDLESGYTSLTPGYSPITTAKAPFPPVTEPGQYLSAVAAFGDVQVAGRLGGLSGPASRLQRIRYSPEPCANPDPANRDDYPFFPLTDGSSYTCIRADLQQTSATPDPLALHAIYRADDGNEVRLTNAGINDLPDYIQFTMSDTKTKDGPDGSPKDILRRRCRSNTVETAAQPNAALITDCMPPKIRFDQPLDTVRLFGVLEAGHPQDISSIGAVVPRGALANTMALPTPAGWSDWHPTDPTGIRFRILETDDGNTAVRGSFRLPIPASLTIAHPQSTEVESATDKPNYYTASDTRFHYIVREADGNPVASLGELTGIMQQADGTQILVGAPCAKLPAERRRALTDNANVDDLIYSNIGAFIPLANQYDCDPDYRRGVPIPGEIGISMYDRTHKGTGTSFLRVDGRVSTPISAGVRMFGGDPTGIGMLEAEIKDVPGTGAGVGPDDASFRLQYMSLGEGEDPPTGGGGGGSDPPEPCVFCTETNVRLEKVFASFDFKPGGSNTFARRVNATLRSDGLKNGLELESFSAVEGGTHTPVRVVAEAKVNPLDFQAHLDLVPVFDDLGNKLADFISNELGLPDWIGDVLGFVVKIVGRLIANLVHVRVELESRLEAGLDFQSHHLEFRQNLLTTRMENHGGGDARAGPFDLYVKQLEAYAAVGVRINLPWPLPDVVIGFTLLHVYFLPAFHDLIPFNLQFIDCGSPLSIIASTVPGLNLPAPLFPNSFGALSGQTKKIVIWPFQDQRMTYGGFLGPLVQLGSMLAGPFFCFMGVDDGDIPLGVPGDPVTETRWAGHRVFTSALLDPSTLTPGAPGGIGEPDPPPAPPPPPPPPPLPLPHPDFTINAGLGDVGLCGVHEFGTLTIDGGRTLSVATGADGAAVPTRSGDPARVRCLASDVGSLTILANRIVNNGTIDATGTQATALQPQGGPNPIYTGSPASGNSGGGHHGAGGTGSQGTGGQAYTDPAGRTSGVTERGMPGAGTAKGNGGGVIQLLVEPQPFRVNPALPEISYQFGDIQSTGTIRANGTVGGSDTSGTCGQNDDPSTDDGDPNTTADNEFIAFSGNHAPGGGGGGGGVVLAASRLDLSGPIQAFGGNGGFGRAGGGGGGGGGVVKLIAPVQRLLAGFSVNVGFGTAGGACTAGDSSSGMPKPQGNAGGAGDRVDVVTPLGSVQAPATFWNRNSASLPVRAEGSYSSSTPSGFTVYVCGSKVADGTPPPYVDNAPVSMPGPPGPEDTVFSVEDLFTVPQTGHSTGDPCGTATQLASKSFSVFTIDPADANGFVNVPLSGTGNDGTWGTYTMVVRGSEVSRPPKKVQSVFGIDNSAPTVNITAPAANFETTNVGVGLNFTSGDQALLSGVALIECRNSVAPITAFVSCASGGTFNLSPGDGAKQITVRVTDNAGNTATATVNGTLSNSPPTASAIISGGTIGGGSWYTSAPSYTINNYSQSQGIAIHPDTPFFWRFDDLPETACVGPATSCTVPASAFDALPPGEHRLHFTAMDRLGNRLFGDEMTATPIVKWDKIRPLVELTLVPRDPDTSDGSNLWFTDRPFVVVSGIDGFGESGLASRQVQVDGGGFVNFTVPFELQPGTHTVDVRSTDVAGNPSLVTTRTNIRVDDVAPDIDISLAGGTAGNAGWFIAPPTVTFGGFSDNAGGAGAATSGPIRWRLDNGGDQLCGLPSCAAPTLATGNHLIGAYGVDGVGNIGSETESDGNVTVKVDGEKPTTTISVRTDVPDGLNGWYRRDLPWVQLNATDQPAGYGRILPIGSGVALVEVSLNGGATFSPYTGPFQLLGGYNVCARATDVAGNVEAAGNCKVVKGDNIDPTIGISLAGPAGLGSWWIGPTTVTVSSADTGGSSLVTPGAVGTPCWWAPPPAPVPAGTCVSVDGRPFVQVTGPLTLDEGEHVVHAFSVDSAGNRSATAHTIVNIDRSPAVQSIRLVPFAPRTSGWYRTQPNVVVRTVDGDQNSGVGQVLTGLNAPPASPYAQPIEIPAGRHTFGTQAVDLAGLPSPLLSQLIDVDVTDPVPRALSPTPAIWLRLYNLLGILNLSTPAAQLHWDVKDDLGPTARVRVLVFNQTGNVVRQLDHGPLVNITPGGPPTHGVTMWDGRDHSLTGIVPVGLYYYRVVVVDEAGNVAQSGESRPIQIKLG